MDQKLKERLLGAVIILSVLIVVLPILFKPNNENLSELYQEDPFDEDRTPNPVVVALDNHLLKDKPSKNVMSISIPVPAPRIVEKIVSPVSKEIKVWVLRMGIFSDPQNAKSLVEKLTSQGYPAYSKVDTVKGAKMTRVFVGPSKYEHDIKKIRDHLKKDLHLEGMLLFIKDPELGVV